MWRGLADIAETYLRKGSQIYVEGRIRSRSYDAKDGNKRFITEIQVDNLVLLGSRRDSGDFSSPGGQTSSSSAPSPSVQPAENNTVSPSDDKDDLPF
jgi:single-strand DNA-binding protein